MNGDDIRYQKLKYVTVTIKKFNNFFHEGKLTLYYINFSFARNDTINQLVDCSHGKSAKEVFFNLCKTP